MRCLLINLDRSPDRLSKMDGKFRDVDLPYERLTAVDGQALSSDQKSAQDHEIRKRLSVYPLTDSEMACGYSHILAMEQLMEGREEMLAVFEDDLDLSPDIASVLCLIEEKAKNFDFIFLHRKFKRGEFFVPCGNLSANYKIGRVGYAQMGALAYVVSRKGAEKYLSFAAQRRFGHAIDKEIHRWWASGMDVYGLDRPVVWLSEDVDSLIEATRKTRTPYEDSNQLKWKIRRLVVRLYDSVVRRILFWPYVLRGRKTIFGKS